MDNLDDSEEIKVLLWRTTPEMNLPSSYFLLDVGCGSGSVLKDIIIKNIPQHYGKIVGLDMDEDEIKECKKLFNDPDDQVLRTKCSFIVGDIENPFELLPRLPSFDLITSFSTLQLVGKKRRAFENMSKLLNPGGHILVKMVEHKLTYDSLWKMSRQPRWEKYMRDFEDTILACQDAETTRKLMEKLLKDIFDKVKVTTEFHVIKIPQHRFREKLTELNVFLENIKNEKEKAAFMDEFVSYYGEVLESGSYVIKYQATIMVAQKRDVEESSQAEALSSAGSPRVSAKASSSKAS